MFFTSGPSNNLFRFIIAVHFQCAHSFLDDEVSRTFYISTLNQRNSTHFNCAISTCYTRRLWIKDFGSMACCLSLDTAQSSLWSFIPNSDSQELMYEHYCQHPWLAENMMRSILECHPRVVCFLDKFWKSDWGWMHWNTHNLCLHHILLKHYGIWTLVFFFFFF